jgi:hypothetical protein
MDLKKNGQLPAGFEEEYGNQAKLILAMTNTSPASRPGRLEGRRGGGRRKRRA